MVYYNVMVNIPMCYNNLAVVNMYWHYRKLVYKIIVNGGGYRITYFVAGYWIYSLYIYIDIYIYRERDEGKRKHRTNTSLSGWSCTRGVVWLLKTKFACAILMISSRKGKKRICLIANTSDARKRQYQGVQNHVHVCDILG